MKLLSFLKIFLISLFIFILFIFIFFSTYKNMQIFNIYESLKRSVAYFDKINQLKSSNIAEDINSLIYVNDIIVLDKSGNPLSILASKNLLDFDFEITQTAINQGFKDGVYRYKLYYSDKFIEFNYYYNNYIFLLIIPYSHILIPFQYIILFVCLFIFLLFTIYLSSNSLIKKTYLSILNQIIFNLNAIKLTNITRPVNYTNVTSIDDKIYVINSLFSNISSRFIRLVSYNKKIEFLINNMSSGIIQVDKKYRITTINLAAKHMFNVDSNIIGKNIIYLSSNKKFIDCIENAIINKSSSVIDIDMTSSNGSILSFSVSPINSVFINKNESVRAIIFISNVTESRKIEQMKSEFVENISHELKTPVTSILGFSELLLSDIIKDSRKSKDYLMRIKSEANRINNLTCDILNLYALENNQIIFDVTKVNLLDIVNQLFESMDIDINRLNIQHNVIGYGYIFADSNDIYALLKNLIENSIRYNKLGGKIDLILSEDDLGVNIVISDTGIGIPEEDQVRVFERFYRVDKSRSRSNGGTGLGLSIVKHIVSKYNGKIELESSQNFGTKISVYIRNWSEKHN